MKKLLLLSIIIFSCAKETIQPIDERDKFTGSWKGLLIYQNTGFLETWQFDKNAQIKSKMNVIRYKTNGTSNLTIDVNGSSFTINQLITSTATNVVILEGNGKLDKDISLIMPFKVIENGITYVGTFTGSLTKQYE